MPRSMLATRKLLSLISPRNNTHRHTPNKSCSAQAYDASRHASHHDATAMPIDADAASSIDIAPYLGDRKRSRRARPGASFSIMGRQQTVAVEDADDAANATVTNK